MGLCLGRRYKCNTEIFQMPNFSGNSVGDKVMPQLGVQHGVFYLVQRIWGWHSDIVDLVTPGWVRLDCERSWLQGSNKLKPVPWTKHTKQGVVKGVVKHHENIPSQQFQIRSFTSSSSWPYWPTSLESYVPQVAGQHSFSISEGASCPSPSGAFGGDSDNSEFDRAWLSLCPEASLCAHSCWVCDEWVPAHSQLCHGDGTATGRCEDHGCNLLG